MSTLSENSAYNESPHARFPMTLTMASQELGISIQRLSRYLKALKVPVSRQGYSVLLNSTGYARVKRALERGEIKRGRKKKAS